MLLGLAVVCIVAAGQIRRPRANLLPARWLLRIENWGLSCVERGEALAYQLLL